MRHATYPHHQDYIYLNQYQAKRRRDWMGTLCVLLLLAAMILAVGVYLQARSVKAHADEITKDAGHSAVLRPCEGGSL